MPGMHSSTPTFNCSEQAFYKYFKAVEKRAVAEEARRAAQKAAIRPHSASARGIRLNSDEPV
eukprot:6198105-Pleurochrysis_carterae.AAC.1